MHTRVIAVANHKGGTLKTTTTINVAQVLSARGHPTLVIDTDEQCNATSGLGETPDDGTPDILSIRMRQARTDEAIRDTQHGVHILPASKELSNVDAYFQRKPALHSVLKTALKPVLSHYAYILIDCPGSLSNMTLTALAAADEVLVPVAAGSMELEAVHRFEEHLAEQTELLNPNIGMNHILIGRADLHQVVDRDILHALQNDYPDQTMQTIIPKSVRVTESYSAQQPVTVYAPDSKPAQAFRQAADELNTRTGK